jgi:multiple sugar transport system substrate-binding protein
MKRRLVTVLAMLAVVAPLLCAGGAKPDAASDKVVLELWNITGKEAYYSDRCRQFEKLYPNVTVRDEWQIHADYEKKLPTAIASGTAPDIWNQSYRSVVDFKDQLQPLADDLAKFAGYADAKAAYDSWVPAAIEQYMVDGKIYAFIWEANYFGWAINKKHFTDAGLDPEKDYPKTWEDVVTVGKKLTQRRDGRIYRHAVVYPYPRPPIWYMMVIQPMMIERGVDFFGKDGQTCTVNDPEVVETVKFFKRFFDEGITDKALSTTQDYQLAMQNGETSMGICSFIGWIDIYEKANPAIAGQLAMHLNPTMPGKTPVHAASTWAFGVNAKTTDTKKAWAWRLIDFLTKDPSSAIEKGGTLIPRQGWEKTEGGKKLRDSELIAEAVRTSFPSGTLVHWNEIQLPVQKALQRIYFEDADIKTELDKAKAEVDAAIKSK